MQILELQQIENETMSGLSKFVGNTKKAAKGIKFNSPYIQLLEIEKRQNMSRDEPPQTRLSSSSSSHCDTSDDGDEHDSMMR